MKRGICFCIWLLPILLMVGSCCATDMPPTLFPLKTGNYWIYRGKIKWIPPGGGHSVRLASITWQMTVHEVVESPRYKIALISGFPGDLEWYTDGMKPMSSLLVEDDKCVFIERFTEAHEALKVAKTIEAGENSDLNSFHCIIKFPLGKGKKYDSEGNGRADTRYAWYVESVDTIYLKTRGCSRRRFTRYRLVYRTLPDTTIMDFVPGVGITRYFYEHHGTVGFEDLRLFGYSCKKW